MSIRLEEYTATQRLAAMEIISNAMEEITDEVAATLEGAGVTANTTQQKDYMTGLYAADGRVLTGGEGTVQHVPCGSFAIVEIMRRYGSNGINPGDVFLSNDPYVAAIHQSDVYIISPIHYEAELVAWVGTFVHVMDIGALSPGGNSPNAREVFHEGVRVAALRIAEAGVLREDLVDMLVNMTRQPKMVLLDIRCQLAANFVARQRMQGLMDRYGLQEVRWVWAETLSETQRVLERRLASIQDGVWEAEGRVGGASHSLIHLVMTKVGGKLTFDFAGSAPASDVGINLPVHSTLGFCFAAFMSTLGFDLPRNDGALSVLEVRAPGGSIVNPTFPSPVSMNTTSSGSYVRFLAGSLLQEMIAGDPIWYEEVLARSRGSRTTRIAGYDETGEYFVTTLAGVDGGGARMRADGVDSGGFAADHGRNSYNIEWMEERVPVLFLFHSEIMDGGGAGRFRGGSGDEVALIPWRNDSQKGDLTAISFGVTGVVNSGAGLLGGISGAPSLAIHFKDTSVRSTIGRKSVLPAKLADIDGHAEFVGNSQFIFGNADVLYMRYGSGGGIGDPLDRDPSLVIRDVKEGLVSNEVARNVYGVVLDGERERFEVVDAGATEKRRSEIRTRRLSRLSGDLENSKIERIKRIDQGTSGEVWIRHTCFRSQEDNGVLGGDERHHRIGVIQVSPAEAGGKNFALQDPGEVSFEHWICTSCGTLLNTEVASGSARER